VTTPSVPLEVWLLAAVDPFLVVLAAYLGFKADQFGKVALAAIIALAGSVLLNWLATALGLPSLAPVSREGPLLIPRPRRGRRPVGRPRLRRRPLDRETERKGLTLRPGPFLNQPVDQLTAVGQGSSASPGRWSPAGSAW
jgi:hypothetical protein